MTVFLCDGFESYGDTGSAGADVEALINNTNRQLCVNNMSSGDISIISDFEGVGYAVQIPDYTNTQSCWFTYEWPDGTGRNPDYKFTTNGSALEMCCGFRMYNPSASPAIQVVLWQGLSGATTSLGTTLILKNDQTSLILRDSASVDFEATDVLSTDTWHYIEIAFKPTTDTNSGWAKVYVDGNLVIDEDPFDFATFPFVTTWGMRLGVTASTNQLSGNNFAFDDVYCMELDGVEHTAPLGSCRVFAMRPTSDATPNDWTPSTGGDNYALVDDTDVDETDYVDATTTGDDDHYGLSALENVSSVHGVRIDVACVAVDGTPNLHIGFDNGTADEDDMGTIGTGTTVNIQEFHAQDPSSADWTESSVESVEATQRMTE